MGTAARAMGDHEVAALGGATDGGKVRVNGSTVTKTLRQRVVKTLRQRVVKAQRVEDWKPEDELSVVASFGYRGLSSCVRKTFPTPRKRICLPGLVGDGFTHGHVLVLAVGAENLVSVFAAYKLVHYLDPYLYHRVQVSQWTHIKRDSRLHLPPDKWQ